MKALQLAAVVLGGVGAAALDAKYPDKTKAVLGVDVTAGMAAAVAAVGLGVVGVPGALLLGAGGLAFAGGRTAATRLLPAAPPPAALPAGTSGYGLPGVTSSYGSVADRELMAALAAAAAA